MGTKCWKSRQSPLLFFPSPLFSPLPCFPLRSQQLNIYIIYIYVMHVYITCYICKISRSSCKKENKKYRVTIWDSVLLWIPTYPGRKKISFEWPVVGCTSFCTTQPCISTRWRICSKFKLILWSQNLRLHPLTMCPLHLTLEWLSLWMGKAAYHPWAVSSRLLSLSVQFLKGYKSGILGGFFYPLDKVLRPRLLVHVCVCLVYACVCAQRENQASLVAQQ